VTIQYQHIDFRFFLIFCREMIADGAWKRNNATNYITCDEYDGKNSPKRIGLNLKKYFNKDTSETPTYGPMSIISNGYSFMEFNMQLSAVGVRESSSDKSIPLGTWKAGYDSNLTLLDPQNMKNYTADVVYRIVTVEVPTSLRICEISEFIYIFAAKTVHN
jgi:ionotropic glutamate receptor